MEVDLGMMKDGFPKDEVTVRRPGKVVESMVRVLRNQIRSERFPGGPPYRLHQCP